MANETILVVDGDSRSRKILEVSFKKSGYRVRMTDSIEGALDYLDGQTPDLIVSETELPDGDGFAFCKEVKAHSDWEHIPFLFLTEESSLPRKIKGLEIGADDYLTRPIYIKEVTTRVEVLLQKRDRELLAEADVEEFEGELADITLIDLLQTFDSEERTGLIEFQREDRSGTITFREGNAIDASCGKLRGAEAVYRLMLWPRGDFVVRYYDEVPGSDRIDMTTEDLLFEGIYRLEEWEEIVDSLPSLDRIYETDYEKLPEFMDRVPDQVGRIARLFDGYRTLRDVIDDSPVGDVTAGKIICGVFAEELLEDVTPKEGEARRTTAEERSHLADWLESNEALITSDFEGEEDTSPGHPASGDPRETQEIERDDLASALSDEIEARDAEHGGFGEQEVSESGPRYQPTGDEEPTFEFAAQDPGEEGPASVDETLRELEQAERMRRKEEAKRLVKQKPEVNEQEASEESLERAELESGEEEGVPRIPGATKTRNAPESGEQSPVAEGDADDSTQSGEWMRGDGREEGDGPAKPSDERGRDKTPRAHPTQEEQTEQEAENDSGRSRKPTREGVGEADLAQEDSGVPVSFETVDAEPPAESADAPDEDDEEDVSTSAERRAVSVDEAESVKDEAAAAVRESAREALEQASKAAEDLPEDEGGAGEEGRERRGTIPFGDAALEGESAGLQEVTPEPIDRGDDSGPPGPPPEKVERVSTNGEVVRAEYDLTGPPEESASEEVSADDTLEGAADETLEGLADSEEAEEADRDDAHAREVPEPKEAEDEEEDEDEEADASGEMGLAWDDEPTARPGGSPDGSEGTFVRDPDRGAPGDSGEVGMSEADIPSGDTEPEFEPAAGDTEEPVEADEEASGTVSGNDEEVTDEIGADQVSDVREKSRAAESEQISEATPEQDAPEADEVSEESTPAADETDRVSARGSEPAERDETEKANEATEGDVQTEQTEAPADSEDRPVDDTAEVEAAEAGENRVADRSSEVHFFEEDEQQEEEFDWDFEEEVDDDGTWGWAVGIGALVGVSLVVVWAFVAGPFSSSKSDSTSGGEEEIATSDEPTSETTDDQEGTKTGAAAGSAPSEEDESTVSDAPPAVTSKKGARRRARAAVDSVDQTARKATSLLATGFPPDAGAPAAKPAGGPDAGSAQASKSSQTPKQGASGEEVAEGGQQAASAASQGSQTQTSSSSGGGIQAEIARVRQYIRSGQYTQAQSALRELRDQAANRASVAQLYLQLGSGLQNADRPGDARTAYENFLDLRSEGQRAEEVRHILNNEL